MVGSQRTVQDARELLAGRVGHPRTGRRSIGRLGRRMLALAVDWGLSVLVSVAFFDYSPWATLDVYAITQIVFVATAGGSVGHLITGMRVVPLSGSWVGVWRPIVRTSPDLPGDSRGDLGQRPARRARPCGRDGADSGLIPSRFARVSAAAAPASSSGRCPSGWAVRSCRTSRAT